MVDKKLKCYWSNSQVHFSKREIETIYHLLNGRTAKLSAIKMGISHRTIESYIEKIKQKLGCQYKRDIFSKIDTLKFLEYYLT